MKSLISIIVVCLLSPLHSSVALSDGPDPFPEWYRGWTARDSIASAQVVLVARVTHVGKVKVVEGAKTNRYFREYRFQPLNVLKGVYTRDELTMSAQDLGCLSATGINARDFKEGQLRILTMSQSSPLGSRMACVGVASAANFRQAVPLLSGADDPIVGMYKSMIKIDQLRSRKHRVQTLVESIKASSGPALVPLLNAIRKDLIWAAANQEFCKTLIKICQDDDPIVQQLAFDLVCDTSHWMIRRPTIGVMEGFQNRLNVNLTSGRNQKTVVRLKALNAAIALEKIKPTKWLGNLLVQSAFEARTNAERSLAIRAVGDLGVTKALPRLVEELESLPLDGSDHTEVLLLDAIRKIAPSRLFGLAKGRIEESLATGQNIYREFQALEHVRTDESGKLIASLLGDPNASQIQTAVIDYLGKRNPTGSVEQLGEILRNDPALTTYARQSLLRIGNEAAAKELRPFLKTLRRLDEKLPIAKLLAKHGMNDGYSMAIEHVADGGNVSQMAAEVLKEIDSEDARGQLLEILEAEADRKWYVGAVAGLLAMDHEKGQKAFDAVISDDHHPLLLETLPLSRFAGRRALLNHAPNLIASRNVPIARATLTQVKSVLAKEPLQLGVFEKDKTYVVSYGAGAIEIERKLLKSLKKLVADSYVDQNIRKLSLEILTKYETSEISEWLIQFSDQVGNTHAVSAMVENEIRKRGIDLNR